MSKLVSLYESIHYFVSSDRSSLRYGVLLYIIPTHPLFEILTISANFNSFSFCPKNVTPTSKYYYTDILVISVTFSKCGSNQVYLTSGS